MHLLFVGDILLLCCGRELESWKELVIIHLHCMEIKIIVTSEKFFSYSYAMDEDYKHIKIFLLCKKWEFL